MTSPRKPLASLSSLLLLGSDQRHLNEWSCPPRLVPCRCYVYSNESAIVLPDSTNVEPSVIQQWQYCQASKLHSSLQQSVVHLGLT